MIRKTILGALLVLIPTFLACQRSPAEDQAAIDEAQRKADDVAARARSEAEQKAAMAQAKVDDEARRAAEAFAKARDDLRTSTQRDIDAVTKRLDEIEARMNKVSGRRRAELAAALKELDEKRASLQQALASVDAVSPQGFESLKATLNARIEELRKAVDQLNART